MGIKITLAQARGLARVTASQVADYAGISTATVYKYEYGGSYPSVPVFRKMVEFYQKNGAEISETDIFFAE